MSIATATGAFAHILWDASIKGVLLLILVLAVLLVFRGISAALRHMVLVAAVSSLVVIPVLSWTLPAWRVLPFAAAPSSQAKITSAVAAAPIALESAEVLKPVEAATFSVPTVEFGPGEVTQLPILATAKLAGADFPWATPHAFLAVWVVGSLLLMMRLAASRLRLCEVEDTATPVCEGQLVHTVDRLKQRLGLERRVDVMIGASDVMPMTWGLFRAQLLLPSECEAWSRSKLDAVILHELAHVRRCDVATQFIVQFVSAIFWFNPVVWLVAWRIRIERERACDDLVLGAGVTAPDYAENLLGVVTGCEVRPQLRSAAIAMGDKVRIEGRLKSILNDRLNRGPVTKPAGVFAAVALATAILPLAMLQADDEEHAAGDTDHPDAVVADDVAHDSNSDAPEPAPGLPVEPPPIDDAVSTDEPDLMPSPEELLPFDDPAGEPSGIAEELQPEDVAAREALKSASALELHFTNAELEDVLRFLFEEADVPYILPSGLVPRGRLVTFKLDASPFAALEKIAEAHGYRVERIGDAWDTESNCRENHGQGRRDHQILCWERTFP